MVNVWLYRSASTSGLELSRRVLYNTTITVVDEDTLTIASQESNVCCLNFASNAGPGGGYKSVLGLRMPIKTQEEDLFRRSNLPELMDVPEVRSYYPLKDLQGLYCVATVHLDKNLDSIEPFQVGVITVPAVVNPKPEDQPLVQGKARRILEIAEDRGHEVVVLGAWGCGVFGNDPRAIVNLFLDELKGDFAGVFRKVIFGVPGATSHNHKIFREAVDGIF